MSGDAKPARDQHLRWPTWKKDILLVVLGGAMASATSIYALHQQERDFQAQLHSQALLRDEEEARAVFNDFSAITNRLSLARQNVWASKSDSTLAEYLRAERDWNLNEPHIEALLATYFGSAGQNYFEATRSDLREFDNLLCLWTQYTGNDAENSTHNLMFSRSEWEELSRTRIADISLQTELAKMIRDGKIGALAPQAGAIGPPMAGSLEPISCGAWAPAPNTPYLAPDRISR